MARALMVGRAGGEDLIANEALVKHPFDANHERCGVCSTLCFYTFGLDVGCQVWGWQ